MGQVSGTFGQGEDDGDVEISVSLPGELYDPDGPGDPLAPPVADAAAGPSDAPVDGDGGVGGVGPVDGDGDDLDGDAEVTVDLADWSELARTAAAERLREAGVPHWWVGAEVHGAARDAAAIDEVLDEVDAEPDPLDPDEDQVAYDMSEWDDDRLATLGVRLDDAEIPFSWDGEELFVYARDEEAVDELIDAVEHPDELPAEPDPADGDGAGGDGAGGEVDPALLGDLFVAADHIQHDPKDHEQVGRLLLASRSVEEGNVPYGLAKGDWRHLCERVDTLADLLCEDEPDEEAVVTAASDLRTSLRPYV